MKVSPAGRLVAITAHPLHVVAHAMRNGCGAHDVVEFSYVVEGGTYKARDSVPACASVKIGTSLDIWVARDAPWIAVTGAPSVRLGHEVSFVNAVSIALGLLAAAIVWFGIRKRLD
jgi:hypothetical protein